MGVFGFTNMHNPDTTHLLESAINLLSSSGAPETCSGNIHPKTFQELSSY